MTSQNGILRDSAPVIAICGRPGSGKSTLAHLLADCLTGASIVEWDDFETLTKQSPDAIAEWLRTGGDVSVVNAPGLTQALAKAAAQGPVVFEAPFGRSHPASGSLISLAVWIETDADLALARKVQQLISAGAEKSWLQGYLQAYERIVRPSCQLQIRRVAPGCDYRLTNDGSVQSLLSRFLALPEIVKMRRKPGDGRISDNS